MKGMPDMLSEKLGSEKYLSFWNPDFLAEELGKNGTCSRFYFEQNTAVDVGNPASKVSLKKQKLLTQHGFRYLCFAPSR
jgi:hypothetical protein